MTTRTEPATDPTTCPGWCDRTHRTDYDGDVLHQRTVLDERGLSVKLEHSSDGKHAGVYARDYLDAGELRELAAALVEAAQLLEEETP